MASEQPAAQPETFARLEEVRTYYASKEDLARMETRLIKWIVSSVLTAVVIATGLAALIVRLAG